MALNTKSTRRLYDRIEPYERLRLAVAALARHDLDEHRHLIGTTPRADVTAPDPEVLEVFDELRDLVWRFLWLSAAPIAQLRLLTGLDEIADMVATEVGDALDSAGDLVFRTVFVEGRTASAARLRALVDAFADLGSERFGLPRAHLLGVLYPSVRGALETHAELLQAAAPDAETRDRARAVLAEAFEPAEGS